MYKEQTKNIQTAIIEHKAYAQLFNGDKRVRKLCLLFPDGKTKTLSGQTLQEVLDLAADDHKCAKTHDIKAGSASPCSNTDWLILRQ